MAGRGKNKTELPEKVVPNAMVASAARLNGYGPEAAKAKNRRRNTAWYDAAWGFYDTVGEYRFSVNWVGNMLSRASLYVGRKNEEGSWERVEDENIQAQLDSLATGAGGQAEMLQRLGVILTVPGQADILGWTDEETGEEQWVVAAPNEVQAKASGKDADGNTTYRYQYNDKWLPEETAYLSIVRPHPRDSRETDSPSRAALPILSEIWGLTEHVSAQIDSRLAGAGILLIPQEMQFPEDEEGNQNVNTLIKQLNEVMQTAIKDRSHASARVPIVLSGPGELLEYIRHVTFATPLDENSIELRTEAIRRLALSMDMPPEVLTGVGDVNHWQAWAIDESAIKVHAMPPLQLIVSSLTVNYLRPRLRDVLGIENDEEYAVLADTAQMRTRPNRSREALELFDRHLISAEAVVREVGFDPDDIMDMEGLRKWLLVNAASGSTTPDIVVRALEALGVDIPGILDAVEDEETQESRPAPSLQEHPDEGPPESEMLALAEPIVTRALERAGNKMRNRNRGREDVPARQRYLHEPPSSEDVPKLLEGAWEGVPELCEGRSVDPVAFTQALDSYCRVLLVDGKPHERQMLNSYIRLMTQATA